jgi:hypothetical protein
MSWLDLHEPGYNVTALLLRRELQFMDESLDHYS